MVSHTEIKNKEKDLTISALTDYDTCELVIRCVQVFAETASRADLEKGECIRLGKELWKETVKILKEYRNDNP